MPGGTSRTAVISPWTPTPSETIPKYIALNLGPPQPSLACIAGIVCDKHAVSLEAVLSGVARAEASRRVIAWLAACWRYSPREIGMYLRCSPALAAAMAEQRDLLIKVNPFVADRMIGLVALIEAACP